MSLIAYVANVYNIEPETIEEDLLHLMFDDCTISDIEYIIDKYDLDPSCMSASLLHRIIQASNYHYAEY